MKQRIISGVIIAIAILALGFVGSYPLYMGVLFCCLIGYLELTAVLCASALLLVLGGFLGLRVFHWFQPEMPQDEIIFADETIRSAVRSAVGGGVLTEENTAAIEELRLDSLPSGWEDLEKLPKLTRIVLPQQAVLKAESLPDAGVVLVLTGGDAS